MISGLNSNVRHGDRLYHVQTEDLGTRKPLIETTVYVGGAIIAVKKQTYARSDGNRDETALKRLMVSQHREMIDALISGAFDETPPRE